MSQTKSITSVELIRRAHADHGIVGRERELGTIHLAVSAGRHLLIEGPVGVGKTVLAQAVAGILGREVVRVDGDSRFTEQKLAGSFDPSRVMKEGYSSATFVEGPLVRAMRSGAVLFVNELNRMPESVQNILLPVLDEGRLLIPQLGWIEASPGFLVMATQNPREFVATSHLSEALIDRMEWVALHSQSLEEESEIVSRSLSRAGFALAPEWVEACTHLIRQTRSSAKVKRGASVRAAIAMAQLLTVRCRDLGVSATDLDERDILICARLALATRIELLSGVTSGEGFESQLDEVILELWQGVKKKPR